MNARRGQREAWRLLAAAFLTAAVCANGMLDIAVCGVLVSGLPRAYVST
jgi:hypothetical protein